MILFQVFDNQEEEIWQDILAALKLARAGFELEDIAFLAPKHRQLSNLAEKLSALKIPYQYEKQENLFEQPEIHYLLILLRFVQNFGNNKFQEDFLQQVLFLPIWGLKPEEIYLLAIEKEMERKKMKEENAKNQAENQENLEIENQKSEKNEQNVAKTEEVEIEQNFDYHWLTFMLEKGGIFTKIARYLLTAVAMEIRKEPATKIVSYLLSAKIAGEDLEN